MNNRFRNPILRNQFDSMVSKYKRRHSDLFTADGVPHSGAGGGQAFWHGYRGTTFGAGFATAHDKQTPAYASWRAGQACRAAEGSSPAFPH